MMTRLCTAAVLALLFSFCPSADAQVFSSGGAVFPQAPPVGLWLHQAINGELGHGGKWKGPPPRYVAPEYYDYLNKRYPKFRGGFHSSYFHNMGLPPGDIGPRGNGIYPTPW